VLAHIEDDALPHSLLEVGTADLRDAGECIANEVFEERHDVSV
jgi:hypothetical protein